MKVLVTGGAGDVGEFVVERIKPNHEVVVIDIKPPNRNTDVEFRNVDLLDPAATSEALADADVVAHLAAIPHPFDDPGDRVMHVNMVSTYNVLEAVRNNDIRRIVYGGSDSATGFGIHNTTYKPLYLPIDVGHPCWPHESYCLSKYFGEVMCREYSRAYGIEAISVRFLWVLLARNRESVEAILAAKAGGKENWDWLCSYVMPQDVAQMVSQAVDYEMDKTAPLPFEAFFAHAAQTYASMPTLDLARKIWGELPEVRRPEYYQNDPNAPFFDLTNAYEKLGYRPEVRIEDF